jgi:hypothetical protein
MDLLKYKGEVVPISGFVPAARGVSLLPRGAGSSPIPGQSGSRTINTRSFEVKMAYKGGCKISFFPLHTLHVDLSL